MKLTSVYIGGSLNVFYKDGEKNYLGHGWFRVNNEDKAVRVLAQVLTELRFYATGSFFSILGDSQRMWRMTVSQIIDNVSNAS